MIPSAPNEREYQMEGTIRRMLFYSMLLLFFLHSIHATHGLFQLLVLIPLKNIFYANLYLLSHGTEMNGKHLAHEMHAEGECST